MKKKLMAAGLAAAVLGASLTGCQSKPAETTAAETTAAETTKAETEASSEAETTKAETEAAEKPYEGTTLNVMLAYGGAEAAFDAFTEKTGIKVEYVEISTGKALAQLQAENGNTTADIWFGGGVDSYISATDLGYLEQYVSPEAEAINPAYSDADGYWTGLALVPAGFLVNNDVLAEKNLEAPKTWDDLTKEEYKGLIMMSNPNTAGTAKLIINTMIQMKGHDEAMEYFKALDKNIAQYTKSGSGPSKMVGPGECVIAIGFLHDGIYQILQGYDNIQLIVPEDGTSFEVGATAILKGASHPNAAKLWIEYALSPDCVDHAKENGSYQFLVLKNATQPEEAEKFGLDMTNTIDYDFEDAKENSAKYVEDFFEALGSTSEGADSSRFLTE